MEITHVITGSVDVDPGSGTRYLDIPFAITDPFCSYLSTVTVADPTAVTEFIVTNYGDNETHLARDIYLSGLSQGARQVGFIYTSTAAGPLTVNFALVFVDVLAPGVVYGGN